jgi:anti-anti-sigma regulatory factor
MRIAFEDECTMARAEEIHRTLKEALESAEPLDLDFSGATRIDLAFCQILHALRASCRAKGLACTAQPGARPEVATVLAWCGLSDFARESAS